MTLIDRIRAVLTDQPALPLACLCVCVGDSRPEMVATLRRMVQLSEGRGNVQATDQLNDVTQNTASPREAISPARVVLSGGD